jgi:arylsulfatase A-like enzyme
MVVENLWVRFPTSKLLAEHLPTAHGFDEFFGSLYHLNAEQEPENEDYFKDPAMCKKYGTRGVIHTWANPDGTQKIESTGPRSAPPAIMSAFAAYSSRRQKYPTETKRNRN